MELHPRLSEAALQLSAEFNGTMQIGSVDCTLFADLCSRYGVQSFPTLLLFGRRGKVQPFIRSGGMSSAAALADFVRSSLAALVIEIWKTSHLETLLSGRIPPLGQTVEEAEAQGSLERASPESLDGLVVVFNAGSWCGPCTAFKPEIAKTARELAPRFRVGRD